MGMNIADAIHKIEAEGVKIQYHQRQLITDKPVASEEVRKYLCTHLQSVRAAADFIESVYRAEWESKTGAYSIYETLLDRIAIIELTMKGLGIDNSQINELIDIAFENVKKFERMNRSEK